MKTGEERSGRALRRLPASAKAAAEGRMTARSAEAARSRFSRAFADVLSGRFWGRWSVEWQRADPSTPPPDRDRRTFPGEE